MNFFAMQVKCSDLIGRLEPEDQPELPKDIYVEKDETLEMLIEGFWDFLTKDIPQTEFIEKLRRKLISSRDIYNFCLALGAYTVNPSFKFQDYAGFYLTHLIDVCVDKDIKLPLKHIDKKIHHLGRNNTRNIEIYGDVGIGIGSGMKSGFIKINEDAEGYLGINLENGKIEVSGNSGPNTGKDMKGGIIHVHGDVIRGGLGEGMAGGTIIVDGSVIAPPLNSAPTGRGMTGGEIYVNGESYGWISPVFLKGGELYHKGKLIAKDGKILG